MFQLSLSCKKEGKFDMIQTIDKKKCTYYIHLWNNYEKYKSYLTSESYLLFAFTVGLCISETSAYFKQDFELL